MSKTVIVAPSIASIICIDVMCNARHILIQLKLNSTLRRFWPPHHGCISYYMVILSYRKSTEWPLWIFPTVGHKPLVTFLLSVSSVQCVRSGKLTPK